MHGNDLERGKELHGEMAATFLDTVMSIGKMAMNLFNHRMQRPRRQLLRWRRSMRNHDFDYSVLLLTSKQDM